MTWLVDPETRELLPAIPKADNWPPRPLSIYADLDYEQDEQDPGVALSDVPMGVLGEDETWA